MTARAREAQATRIVKQLIEPDFVLPKKQPLPKPLKKAIAQTSELIDTQRKSLQRLSNERAEANDKIIQERIIAERQRLPENYMILFHSNYLQPPCYCPL